MDNSAASHFLTCGPASPPATCEMAECWRDVWMARRSFWRGAGMRILR